MRCGKRSFWAYVILSFVFVNELSAKPAPAKKEKPVAPVVEAPVSENKVSPPSIEAPCGSWNRVQLGGGAMLDSNDGKAGALSVTWNPSFPLASSLSLKGYLGGMVANLFAGSGFAIGDLGLVLKYDLSSVSVEVGGGLQYWTGTRLRNTFSQIKAGIGFEPFIITYASVFDSLATTHQVLGAISITF